MQQRIELLARGVITKDGKTLFCKNKKGGYYYLPGGHIEFGERAEEALRRELKEELLLEVEETEFIGALEHFYENEEGRHHELNLVFRVEAREIKEKSQEDYIEFEFLSEGEMREKEVLPKVLGEKVLEWRDSNKVFWS